MDNQTKRNIAVLNATLNDITFLRTNGSMSYADYHKRKREIQKRIKELKYAKV